jgi:hypothetical protein
VVGEILLRSLPGGGPERILAGGGFRSIFRPDGGAWACVMSDPLNVERCDLRFEGIGGTIASRQIALPRPFTAVQARDWSPDGHTFAISLATTTPVGELYLIHLDREGAMTGPIPLEGVARHLAFSPDNRTLAVHTGYRLAFHDAATGTLVVGPIPSPEWTGGMAFLGNDRLLTVDLINGATHTCTRDVPSGKPLDERDWQIGSCYALAVAPDGMRAAVGSNDGRILVFDLD